MAFYFLDFSVDMKFSEDGQDLILKQLLNEMIEFETLLSKSCKQNSLKEMVKLWFKPKPMGTFECMRIELELKYGAE